MYRIEIKTNKRVELVEITERVQDIVSKSKIKEGLCFLFVPHTTAGIIINENADPSVKEDIINSLNKLVPAGKGYSHTEGNADSHIKSSLLGNSLNVFIENGMLCLGTWQGIFFAEGDGPRTREVWVKVTRENQHS
ncbi:MAG: YjbQ family protein [Candidatus Omnitrophica bacterium]|nr:YjbQ family protein [Candidatus Omnitrophota bacterium]